MSPFSPFLTNIKKTPAASLIFNFSAGAGDTSATRRDSAKRQTFWITKGKIEGKNIGNLFLTICGFYCTSQPQIQMPTRCGWHDGTKTAALRCDRGHSGTFPHVSKVLQILTFTFRLNPTAKAYSNLKLRVWNTHQWRPVKFKQVTGEQVSYCKRGISRRQTTSSVDAM